MSASPSTLHRSNPWHSLSAEDVIQKLDSREDGLTIEEVQSRLKRFGANVLQLKSADGPLRLIWRQINSSLIWVLIGSAIVAILLGKVTDGAVVIAVVIINTIIGFIQEYRAGRAIEALIDLVPKNATVLRQGSRDTVAVAEIVPGEIVLLASGDKVPADGRVISARNLRVDEAALTGESVPVEKRQLLLVRTRELATGIVWYSVVPSSHTVPLPSLLSRLALKPS